MKPKDLSSSLALVPALAMLLLAAIAFGQGVVAFHNDGATAVTNSLTGLRAEAGGAFKTGLYYAPYSANVPDDSAFIPIGDAVALDPAGYFIGPNVKIPDPVPYFSDAFFQVRVWEAAYGASYPQAIGAPPMNGRVALRGVSNTIRAHTGPSTTASAAHFPCN